MHECAATTGVFGWIGLAVNVGPGCEVTVHEVADDSSEAFEVYLCPTAAFDGQCDGPLFRGEDGQVKTGMLP